MITLHFGSEEICFENEPKGTGESKMFFIQIECGHYSVKSRPIREYFGAKIIVFCTIMAVVFDFITYGYGNRKLFFLFRLSADITQ